MSACCTLELIDLSIKSFDESISSFRSDPKLYLQYIEEKPVPIVLIERPPYLPRLLAYYFKFLNNLFSRHLHELNPDIAVLLESLIRIDLILEFEISFFESAE